MPFELLTVFNYLILCSLFLLGLQAFPASGSFTISWLFASGGQSIGASASASVLPMNIQGWSSLGLTGYISLLSKGRRVFSTTIWKDQFFGAQPSFWPYSHSYATGKTIAWTIWTFVSKVISLFNTLSHFNTLSIKKQVSFNFMASVIIHSDFEAQENKICHCFHFFPFNHPLGDGIRSHDLGFLYAEF